MRRSLTMFSLLLAAAPCSLARAEDFKPVTQDMLVTPDPSDWLMLNRTYDEQRFSPLDQINASNVAGLQLAFARGLPAGTNETTPIVHDGVMYFVAPGASLQAIDATNGDLIWEYFRTYPKDMAEAIGAANLSRSKSVAIYQDMIYFEAPDGFVVAIDAKTGKLRWETKVQDYHDKSQHTGGLIVADGKVVSNRTCETRAGCFISALDAVTGKEDWRFYNTPADGEPGADTWGGVPTEKRVASLLGAAGLLRPGDETAVLGYLQPEALYAAEAPGLRRRRLPIGARRSLQQLHGFARCRDGRFEVVVPASARRRLGHRPYPRANARAHRRQA